jgi:hypothetical protein
MYTCSLIASETKELPFKYNSIAFSAVYHPEWRAWAGRFDYLLYCQMKQRHCLIIYLGRFLTPEIISQVEATFPWFLPVLEHASGEFGATIGFSDFRDFPSWGISWSLMCCPISFHSDRPSNSALCRAVNFTLQLLAKDPGHELSKPRLGALAMENFERRTCSRETKARRRRDRRYGTYWEANRW